MSKDTVFKLEFEISADDLEYLGDAFVELGMEVPPVEIIFECLKADRLTLMEVLKWGTSDTPTVEAFVDGIKEGKFNDILKKSKP